MRLEGKTAIITGAANGIGAEISRLYAQEGAKVVLADLALEKAQEVADAIVKESGSEAIAVKCNVASKEEVQNVVDICVEKFGKVDIIVNNAGITKDGLLMRMKESDFDAVIDVNLKGTWNCMKHVTKIMMKQRYGNNLWHSVCDSDYEKEWRRKNYQHGIHCRTGRRCIYRSNLSGIKGWGDLLCESRCQTGGKR